MWSAQKLGKIYFFIKICAIMPSLKGIDFKDRNLLGISPGIEAQKPFFDRGGRSCRIISDKTG